MSVQKGDFRTNRADYLIAATKGRSAVELGRDEILERKSLWLRDPRTARFGANPRDSAPGSRARPRGN
ncbi:hypothetical protein C7I87_02080 [Mesorhizobium sp. SARCC-RB16n]|nr:hypothetical protein C7I87_02080 [Mesorhizobium sp. SARCC-RB16n]